jgi:DNA-binding transcriptional LysR family regulator
MNTMHIRNIDLNLLVVFQFLMQERSVSKAAEQIGMSQSGVSHALSRLRDMTKDQLFFREQRRLVPTPRALMMATEVGTALERIKAAVEGDSAFNPQTSQAQFKLMLPDLGETLILPEFLKRTEQLAPSIGIDVRPGFGRGFAREIATGAIHMAMEQQPATDPDIYSCLWFQSDLVAVTAAGQHSGKASLGQDEYSDALHVLYRPEGLTEPPLELLFKRRNIKRRYSTTVSTMLGLVFVSAETGAMATVPKLLAERMANFLPLDILELPFIRQKSEAYLWWPGLLDQSPAHQWFRQLMLTKP